MSLQEMSNDELMCETGRRIAHMPRNERRLEMYEVVVEIERRLYLPKQPYTIRYKFLPNDQDIQKLPGFTVWGSSPLAACQAMVDVNNWRGQNMEFLVETEASGVCVTSKQLE